MFLNCIVNTLAVTAGEDEAAGDDAPITIKFVDQTGDALHFKVKKSTKMEKIFGAYAAKKGSDSKAFRFLLDGRRVDPDNTPKMLELEDEDQIDVMLEYVGGAEEEEKPLSDVISFGVKFPDGGVLSFKVKKTTTFKKVFEAICAKRQIEKNSFRLQFDDLKINENTTPKMLEMVDGDQVDMFVEQLGGEGEGEDEDKKAVGGDDATITLKIVDQTGSEMAFKVKKSTKMEKIFNAYAERKGGQATAYRFVLDGSRVDPSSTPKMLELEDGDQLDAMLDFVGGGADEEDEPIMLVVRDASNGSSQEYRVKKSMPFEKLFNTIATRRGIQKESFRLMFDGERITGLQTPALLNMEDGDMIDYTNYQVGGVSRLGF